jgi:hypothetical protein
MQWKILQDKTIIYGMLQSDQTPVRPNKKRLQLEMEGLI